MIVSVLPVCEVLEFETKAGALASTIQRRADGSVEEITSELFGEQFVLFGDPDRCRCLEYRQFVRAGPAIVYQPSGQVTAIEVPTAWEFHNGGWLSVSEHSADSWIEDARAVDPAPTIWRYGHRGEIRQVPVDQFSTDEYIGDFVYRGFDRGRVFLPVAIAPPGSRIVIDIEFKGLIIDQCTGRLVVCSPRWDWRFDGN